VYVEVDDIPAYLARAAKRGGKTVIPPTDIPQVGLPLPSLPTLKAIVVGLSKGLARPSAPSVPVWD
jgi:hypothetical protein